MRPTKLIVLAAAVLAAACTGPEPQESLAPLDGAEFNDAGPPSGAEGPAPEDVVAEPDIPEPDSAEPAPDAADTTDPTIDVPPVDVPEDSETSEGEETDEGEDPEVDIVDRPTCEDTGCPDGEVCFDEECRAVICETGDAYCSGPKEVQTCSALGTQFFPVQCPSGLVCDDGGCVPPQANLVLLFDTSGSMDKPINSTVSLADLTGLPNCDTLDEPVMKITAAKSVFQDAFSLATDGGYRLALARFPQTPNYPENLETPSCKAGLWNYQDPAELTGHTGQHETGPQSDWLAQNLAEVLPVPFSSKPGDNLSDVAQWLDAVEDYETLEGVACSDCPGFCDFGCHVMTNPELRPTGGSPIGYSLFYLGEYLRRFVLIEGQTCSTDVDCRSPHYTCVDGACHDPFFSCRRTDVILFSDGEDTTNYEDIGPEESPTNSFFHPRNQAKRLNSGLKCSEDSDCAPGSYCWYDPSAGGFGGPSTFGRCMVADDDGPQALLADYPENFGLCLGANIPCFYSDGAGSAECADAGISNSCLQVTPNPYADVDEDVQTLRGWMGQPLRVRTHVIDINTDANDDSQEVAFWGGGLYRKVTEPDSENLLNAILDIANFKETSACE